ncbi:HD domain-containing phosphohydrolase [Sulfuricurvum sp.]|uniref:HD domain-containing phosphohydrolase n=1 Tax=Sulfuricurvum sp. TaxID=2025608 RepID=UPI002E36DBD5|nr:HD domain-containing phosphohydrolase [Sulfuricurvum sp.]HEX5329829.1 HD domain-containing phosphohydrolase [Sulfuricurvum sp.]
MSDTNTQKKKLNPINPRVIEFLGTAGTLSPNKETTCLRVSKHCVIDAGNLIRGMGRDIFDIEHIFLTHSHLDHIVDIPFVAELFVTHKKTPLKIYALAETLNDLRAFIFNYRIWPNFQEIDLLLENTKTVDLIEILPDRAYSIDDITITPFLNNHTEGSCGFVIRHQEDGVLFTSDTYKCDRIWELLESDHSIHSLVIDVSFSSEYEAVARNSKHLTPALLAEERLKSKRDDFAIYPVHLKSHFEADIRQELKESKIKGLVLKEVDDYTVLPFDPTVPVYKKDHNHSFSSQILMIGTALSSEKNIDSLLELIIKQSKLLTNADAGTLYLYNETSKQLEFKVIQNDTLNISMGGRSEPIQWIPLEMYLPLGDQNRHMVATVCALDGYIINIPDVYDCEEYDFSGTKTFDAQTGYRSQSMLVIPLKDHEDNLIGVLQLINKRNSFGDVVEFEFDDEELALSIGSQAAVALTKQKLINDLEVLLESFLHTINMAIEEKSPYTAGHIDRMMDLSLSLANAINMDQTTFAETFYSDEQLKEIKFSALMHDIGKIVLPEYVVDKSTKLETLYDRIETVKLKYELLKRDAQIAFLHSSQSDEDKALRDKTLSALDEEIAFLVAANEGSEYFSDENIERIKSIAARQIELFGTCEPVLSEDEIANLTVQKGTLTTEQREIINNHADISLKMLQALPFPRKLSRVPEIAGAHHEKINGLGYPRGLKGDQLSIEARILAIADIFEALSASDRPYKKAKKLSEIMKILSFMAKDNEIDKNILSLLYTSGVYKIFATKYLQPENIDEVVFEGF